MRKVVLALCLIVSVSFGFTGCHRTCVREWDTTVGNPPPWQFTLSDDGIVATYYVWRQTGLHVVGYALYPGGDVWGPDINCMWENEPLSVDT